MAVFLYLAQKGGLFDVTTDTHTISVRFMPRRPASLTQADIARVIRAAKQARATEVVIKLGEHSLIVRLGPSTGADMPLAPTEEIAL